MECSSTARAKGMRVIMAAKGKLFDHGRSWTLILLMIEVLHKSVIVYEFCLIKKIIPPTELRLVGDQLGGF